MASSCSHPHAYFIFRSIPDLASALRPLVDRLVDLLPIAKRNYYHPDMLGKWSIKAVLPTVAPDMRYSELEEVQDGPPTQPNLVPTHLSDRFRQ